MEWRWAADQCSVAARPAEDEPSTAGAFEAAITRLPARPWWALTLSQASRKLPRHGLLIPNESEFRASLLAEYPSLTMVVARCSACAVPVLLSRCLLLLSSSACLPHTDKFNSPVGPDALQTAEVTAKACKHVQKTALSLLMLPASQVILVRRQLMEPTL